MTGSVVAARVDPKIKSRADYYIEKAGTTQADVIRAVWLSIAQTGKIPVSDKETARTPVPLSLRMRELRGRTPQSAFLESLTPEKLKEELGKHG